MYWTRSWRRHRLWVACGVLTIVAGWAAAPALGAPPAEPLRFRVQAAAAVPSPALSEQLLTPQERAFIAGLPAVRVAVPMPPSQPYETISPAGEVSGIHPDMLVALGKAFGIRMVPVPMPSWSATLQAARERQVDVLMTLGVTSERLSYLAFTLGATPLPGALFALQGAPAVDLATARFALERDYLVNDFVRRQYPQATIVTVETTGEALRAVGERRADYYLGSLLEASDWLSRAPVPGVEATRLLNFSTGHYHFAVRKDWAPLAAILNKGIHPLRGSPNSGLDAALANLPATLRPAPPLALTPPEAAVLVRRPVWRIGAVHGLALLNDIDDRSVHSGIAAEYTEQVARALGVATQVVRFESVADMLAGLRQGSIDLVPFLTRTPGRAEQFAFSSPYLEMPYLLLARSDGPIYWNLGSLAGKRLALALEHPLREVIATRYPQIRIVDAANGNDAMDRVARGEADAAVEVKLFANLRIHGDNDGKLRAVASVDELPAQFHFATLRSQAELLPLVNRALADISPDEQQRMLRRWVAADLAPAFPWRRYQPLMAVSAAALALLAGATLWWVRRLRREVAARRRSEELLNDIAGTVPGVVFRYVFDQQRAVNQHYFSPGANAFLGIALDPRQTLVANLAPHLRAEHRDAAIALERACSRNGERFKFTCAYQPPGGPERWLHAEAVQGRSARGHAVWTGYLVDVSTERQLQAQLASEAQRRNLLLATASHELRAPTNNLSLALQSIASEGLSTSQAGFLRLAREAVSTLGQLLNDVLDAARFDTEPLPLRPRVFNLHALLHELREVWQVAATEKGLAFELSIADDVPVSLTQDPLRLKQVLTNLLSNACKYTAAGRVTLLVARQACGLLFTVRDTGAGVSADAQARLFTPFVTLDDDRRPAPAQGSSGLGLVVARKIAERMGGHLTLQSEPGRGTQVEFELPLVAPAPIQRPEPQAPASGVRPPSIVVCDDDPTSRLLVAHMLRLRGFEVHEADDGAAALQAWRASDAAALVTDDNMPGMSGHDLIRALREAERERGGRPTCVVMCSGNPVPASSATPRLHDAYLLKPVQVDSLVRTLAEFGVGATGSAGDALAPMA